MWNVEMPLLLRLVINDFDEPQKYTDSRLIKLLLLSAQLLKSDSAVATPYSIDLANSTLSPDPTLSATADDNFVNLTILKSACILASAGLVKGSQQAIDIQDGNSRINLTRNLDGSLALIKNFCDAYHTALMYQNYNEAAGHAIIGPYRIFLRNNYGFLSDRYVRGIY